MNPNYGSELHLLRMLGRHRSYLSAQVTSVTGASSIEWLDFPQSPAGKDKAWDQEWQQLDFVSPTSTARQQWAAAWPAGRRGQSWDAVARLTTADGGLEWLLVEAKANLEELASSCAATDPASVKQIAALLGAAKAALGGNAATDWLAGYYQYCNRIATLHWLNSVAGIPSRLLFIYFLGDQPGARRTCPVEQNGWTSALDLQDAHAGIRTDHPLRGRIHKLFLPTRVI